MNINLYARFFLYNLTNKYFPPRISLVLSKGGNGAKSAKAREKAQKDAGPKNAGGGHTGMEARKGGNMAEAMGT